MEEFIRNHRRVPRVPVRLRVVVGSVGGEFAAQTEDVGPGGCRLLCPCLVAAGDLLRLSIESDVFSDALRVGGKVVWCSARTRLRAGVQYDETSRVAAEAWFKRFLEKNPPIAARLSPVPKLIAYSTLLAPAVAEVSPQVHTEDERALFAQVRPGMTVGDLMGGPPAERRDRANALFALIATRALRIEGGDFRLRLSAAPPDAAAAGTGPAPRAAPPTAARSPEAQAKFELAQRLASEGKMAAAIPLLREALKMSPRDAAIAALLARAAFGGPGGGR